MCNLIRNFVLFKEKIYVLKSANKNQTTESTAEHKVDTNWAPSLHLIIAPLF